MIQRLRRVFYGWWVVAAAMGVLVYGGGVYFYGFGVFFRPIREELGWSRAETSLAFSLSSLEGGLEGPVIGALVDRVGARRLMLLGVVLTGLGFLFLSGVDSLAMFYLVYILFLATGSNTANGLPPTAAVANWFVRRRSLAFGILSTGFSFGGAIMVPLLGWLIATYGWRTTALVVGVGMWLIGIPLCLVIRQRPEEKGLLPDGDPPPNSPDPQRREALSGGADYHHLPVGAASEAEFTLREALRTRTWWFLALAFMLRNFALSSIVVHQVTLLVDRGFDFQEASNLLGLVALVGVPGRLIFGYLGDRFPKSLLLVVGLLMQAVGLLCLLVAYQPWQVLVYALLFGFAWGCVPVFMAMRAEYFGLRHFGTIGGFMQMVITAGSMTGPWFAGWIYDVTQSYEIALTTFIAACVIGAVLCYYCTPPQRRSTAEATPVAAA
ncbi:MAG: MFS transporter [Chloroflexi bacterium]|nr:MFS transporter [Chloroflexota bacterium]